MSANEPKRKSLDSQAERFDAVRPMLVEAGALLNGQPSSPNLCLARFAPIEYPAPMSVLLRQVARYVAQRVASDPKVRERVVKAAGGVVEEAKRIAKDGDRAYAAGRAFRRALDKLKGKR